MKRSFILFSAIALSLFSSCSDDDSSDTPEEAIIGSWQLTSESENGESYELDTCDLEETIVFGSDGVFQFLDYDPDENDENECILDDDSTVGEWSIMSEGQLSIQEEDFEVQTVDYTISGNILTVTSVDEGEDETFIFESTYVKL